MLKKMIPFLMILCMLCATPSLHSAAGPRGNVRTFIPLVTTAPQGERIKIEITVSMSDFKAINLEDKGSIEEFIPRAEQPGTNTQKIIIRKGSAASGLSRAVLAEVKAGASAPGGKIIEETEARPSGYTVNMLIATRTKNGVPELVAVQCFIGPRSGAVVQYTVSLNAFSEADALAKVKSFMENNISAIKY